MDPGRAPNSTLHPSLCPRSANMRYNIYKFLNFFHLYCFEWNWYLTWICPIWLMLYLTRRFKGLWQRKSPVSFSSGCSPPAFWSNVMREGRRMNIQRCWSVRKGGYTDGLLTAEVLKNLWFRLKVLCRTAWWLKVKNSRSARRLPPSFQGASQACVRRMLASQIQMTNSSCAAAAVTERREAFQSSLPPCVISGPERVSSWHFSSQVPP